MTSMATRVWIGSTPPPAERPVKAEAGLPTVVSAGDIIGVGRTQLKLELE